MLRCVANPGRGSIDTDNGVTLRLHEVHQIAIAASDIEGFGPSFADELSEDQMDAIAELAYELSVADDDLGFEFEGGDYDSLA